jgi:hypothetical protein
MAVNWQRILEINAQAEARAALREATQLALNEDSWMLALNKDSWRRRAQPKAQRRSEAPATTRRARERVACEQPPEKNDDEARPVGSP